MTKSIDIGKQSKVITLTLLFFQVKASGFFRALKALQKEFATKVLLKFSKHKNMYI
jgi:hypothetical protein